MYAGVLVSGKRYAGFGPKEEKDDSKRGDRDFAKGAGVVRIVESDFKTVGEAVKRRGQEGARRRDGGKKTRSKIWCWRR